MELCNWEIREVWLKAWKEGKQCENSQYLAHSASPINREIEHHVYGKREKGGWQRQADRGAKEETEEAVMPRSPTQGKHCEQERPEPQARQSRGAEGSEPQGAGLLCGLLLGVGPGAPEVTGGTCMYPISGTMGYCSLVQEDNGKSTGLPVGRR